MIEVNNYGNLPEESFCNYMKFLVGQFFKILPTYEQEPTTLKIYLRSLLIELIGNKQLIKALQNDAQFIRLLGTVQYFIDLENIEHNELRREIFKSISIIEHLQKKYELKGDGVRGN